MLPYYNYDRSVLLKISRNTSARSNSEAINQCIYYQVVKGRSKIIQHDYNYVQLTGDKNSVSEAACTFN